MRTANLAQPAPRRERADRRHDARRHPQHRAGAHSARQPRHALPPPGW
ncbi:hypothetical protein [Nocardioides convexus]